ncbi:HAD domain-containing protein [Neobacillus sp. DY30]|uniref:HAD domain-containing protein n=1 Tax=Neobacillus sp. DY30 TaxID=3047871 RepID=UPI0024C089C7|nr:HAD domain-containing protein [Neobacillus sp. DY30]WHX98447.1 HAD domain-containing protein [Neobacillus sp. DY30]
MKIIFFDIDGVLNTDRQIRINNLYQIEGIKFDQEAMENLKKIIEKTKARIVITSTWRIHRRENGYLWSELIRNFQVCDINTEVIIDITPIIDTNMKLEARELEISKWLSTNRNVEKFVILDDHWSMGELNNHFLRCLPFNGITNKIVEEVIKKLN